MGSESFVASQVETSDAIITPHIERFTFTGTGREYFGIWIVNILLTIVTLGIYSAWAKVRNNQYFYGNTYLDNASFEYTAKPMQILRGRIIAVAVFAFYILAESFVPLLGLILALLLFLGSPWIIMKSLAFNANYSQYRGIRFVFHQSLADAAKTFLLLPILAFMPAIILFVIAVFLMDGQTTGEETNLATIGLASLLPLVMLVLFYLAYPFIIYIAKRYIVSNHAYGGEDFRFRVNTPKPFFTIYLKAFALGVVALFLFGAIVAFLATHGLDIASLEQGDITNLDANFIFSVIALYVIGGSIYAFLIAYVKARTYNLVYQNSAIAKHKLRGKISSVDLTLLYITNTIGIALTLGLFIPWAKVRTAKFLANNTGLQVYGDLNRFVATQSKYQDALGEELGEVFDLDIAL